MPAASTLKLAHLVDRVYKKTQEKQIKWEKSSLPDTFSTSLGNFVLHVSARSGDFAPDIWFSIYNSEGEIVEEFSDPDLSGLTPSDFEGYYVKMVALHRAANAQASGADQAIDEILGLLD